MSRDLALQTLFADRTEAGRCLVQPMVADQQQSRQSVDGVLRSDGRLDGRLLVQAKGGAKVPGCLDIYQEQASTRFDSDNRKQPYSCARRCLMSQFVRSLRSIIPVLVLS
ncbi:hypothetical protein N5F23_12870 [Pseudomonas sichuanensis]|uniref:hypothetical protein n=1 Tax=Pseudomonas sichuanensis TaxID=2213015 RepID=UPI002449B3A0|nr:hypothetical protein [Pseudomonas sichuanensis]MDH0731294.1 hypothetical protein [Pseudomonas sichuanensis]MDH1583485.1 hypothetical protein [Pseudomonas sichuanensis]MDH1592777.1 hypothetical protein [Pseudomonas sichuanensis]MDH1598672.1 hypothetical protein [Pseudomonas sichuanensis]